MLKLKQLDELRSVDVNAVDKETLADVSGIILDAGIPQSERMERVLKATKNPYCFRVGDMGVKLEFPDSAPSLQNCISVLIGRKQNEL